MLLTLHATYRIKKSHKLLQIKAPQNYIFYVLPLILKEKKFTPMTKTLETVSNVNV